MTNRFVIAALLGLALCRPAVAAPETFLDFAGDVEVHIKHLAPGEDLIQIIDRTRAVVCYGKMSSGGAATISCQKLK